MNYWSRDKQQRKTAWSYLFNELDPDIALLQEVKIQPLHLDNYNLIYHKLDGKRDWGSAIVAKNSKLFEHHIQNYYPGSRGLIVAEAQVSKDISVTVINIYGLIDPDGYATTTLHHMLSDLTPILHKERKKKFIVLGGDLNISKQWDERYKNKDPLHRIVFDRLEDFGLVNCTELFYGGHIKTYSHNRGDFPWQDDYFFVSSNLKERIKSCEVINFDKINELSDHFPIVLELDL
jgi:exonuclease III